MDELISEQEKKLQAEIQILKAEHDKQLSQLAAEHEKQTSELKASFEVYTGRLWLYTDYSMCLCRLIYKKL